MITLDQVTTVLEKQDDQITDVEVDSRGYARCKLSNDVDPARPYALIVHPIPHKRILRICIPSIAKPRPDSCIPGAMARTNTSLTCGSLGISSSGSVNFQINHMCREGEDDPSPEVLQRLLDETIAALREIEMSVLFGAMVDSGIPRNRVDEIMGILFPETEEETRENEETL